MSRGTICLALCINQASTWTMWFLPSTRLRKQHRKDESIADDIRACNSILRAADVAPAAPTVGATLDSLLMNCFLARSLSPSVSPPTPLSLLWVQSLRLHTAISSGTACGHLDETIFGNEVMTGIIYSVSDESYQCLYA